MKKKAAMELSVGTIVIVVLSMAMLILGIMLVQGIFSGATGIASLAEEQVLGEVNKLFGDDRALVISPSTKLVRLSPGQSDHGFILGLRNKLEGTQGATETFSYEVKLVDGTHCGLTEQNFPSWVLLGRSETGISLTTGADTYTSKVVFTIPSDAPLCTFRVRVEVRHSSNPSGIYAQDAVDIRVE